MIPKTLKRGALLLMVLLFTLNPLKASAHEAYFLQVLVDTQGYNYSTAILSDDDSTFLKLESDHIEAKFGDFRNLIGKEYDPLPTDLTTAFKPNGAESEVTMPFTFPSIEDGDGWGGAPVNDGDQDDANRAYLIKDTLTPGLNDALFVLNGGKMFENADQFRAASQNLSTAISQSKSGGKPVTVSGSTNGSKAFTLQVGKRATDNASQPNDLENGISNTDYLVISDGETEFEYVYRMQKGYQAPTLEQGFDWKNKLYDSRYDEQAEDIGYITWNTMMYQGFYALVAMNLDAKDSGQVAHVGPLEEAVRWMLESIFNGIRNLLGLYSMNELIYNEGIRGSSVWHYGIMPNAWENNVMFYHWIFQAFAWSLISFSIVKLLISRNLATINPSSRVSLIEGVKDLMITGVVLAFIMPLLNMLFMLNARVVDVFAAVGPDLDEMTGLNKFTGFLAGVLLQFFYLIILIWLNFTYIVRSITVAVLTVLAPIFVVTLSLGGRWKGLFMNWMKEMVSNIFLQSFHAFLIGFLYLSQLSSRGIELAVICFAMIPLTEFFRGMIMGQSGDIASRLGMGSLTALGGAASSAAKNAKNSIGASRVKNSSAGGAVAGGTGAGAGSGAGVGAGNVKATTAGGDLKTGSSDKLKQNQAQAQAMGQNLSRTKHQDIRNAQMEKQVPLDIDAKGKDSEEYQRFMGGAQPFSEHEAKVMDFKENLKNDYLSKDAVKNAGMGALKTAGRIALGGAGAGLGAGYALALGGMDSNAARDGLKLAGSSAKFATKGAGAGVAKVYGDLKSGYQLARDGFKNRSNNSGAPVRASVGGAQGLPGGVRSLPSGRAVGTSVATGTAKAGTGVGNTGSMAPMGGSIVPAGSSAPVTPGADLGGAIYANSIGKGNSEVYRDGTVLSEQGILRAHEDDNNNAVFVYDQNKFGVSNDDSGNAVYSQDYHNLQSYKSTFLNGTPEQQDYLRSQGIENVMATGDGNLAVVYNQAGKEAMGFKNVRMSGGNMVETKRADQPVATKASVTVPPMPVTPQSLPQPQRQSGGGSNRGGQGNNYNAQAQGSAPQPRSFNQTQGQGQGNQQRSNRGQQQRPQQGQASGPVGYNSRPNQNQGQNGNRNRP